MGTLLTASAGAGLTQRLDDEVLIAAPASPKKKVKERLNHHGILHKLSCSQEKGPEITYYEGLKRDMWCCPECGRMISIVEDDFLVKSKK